MAKLVYFPLYIDRWVAGTQELTFEERGFYISLLVWMYNTGLPVKDSDHAARLLRCDKRTSRRLLGKLRPKFRLTSAGLRHRLCDELLRNAGKLKDIEAINSPVRARKKPDPEEAPLSPTSSQVSGSESKDSGTCDSSKIDEPPDAPQNVTHIKTRVPYQKILDLYHQVLCPPCPAVEKLTDTRKGFIRQRWQQDLQTLTQWENYFKFVSRSKWLTGQCEPAPGRAVFLADLEWLTRPNNFAKVAEEKYHRG